MGTPRAFTLIELLIALAIGSIIVTVAVPSFRDFLRNNQALSMSTALTASIRLARAEAVKRGARVAVCSAQDAAQTTCGSSGDWANGWIVFIDTNSNGVIASQNDRLKVQQPLNNEGQVTADRSFLAFDGMGFSATGVANFTLTATGCTGNHARQVSISNTGRVSIVAAACP